jgi:ferredoxin/flavodoxin---NADP+ reductase
LFQIVRKKILNPSVIQMDVAAPAIARKAEPGQFIILRVNDDGERIPLTIADFDRAAGLVTIIFQVVGKTTQVLSELSEKDYILDFVGPLGVPSHLDHYNRVAVIGGGLGSAIAYPQAKKLHQSGASVDIIAGFRSKDLIILEDEMRAVCDHLYLTTDDGSNGHKGFVSDVLKQLLDEGNQYDLVIAIGPLIMMKVVSNLTRPYGIKTIVSMNPVMVDGTGMCGGCRITVGGETKFACVDGPDFDGHLVNFDEAMRRQQMYKSHEKQSMTAHQCRLTGQEVGHA